MEKDLLNIRSDLLRDEAHEKDMDQRAKPSGPRKPIVNEYLQAGIGMALGIFCIGFLLNETPEQKAAREAEQAKAATAKAAAKLSKEREKKIERAFSSWDGSHYTTVKLVKLALNDPDSFKHYETLYWDLGDGTLKITMHYGAKNSYGAMIRNTLNVIWDIDSDQIIYVEEG